jgi:hypothetical protein
MVLLLRKLLPPSPYSRYGTSLRSLEASRSTRLDDSCSGDDATSWDFRQQERDTELWIDGEDDVDLPSLKWLFKDNNYNLIDHFGNTFVITTYPTK